MGKLAIISLALPLSFVVLISSGCTTTEAKQPAPQPLPVKTETISLTPVPRVDEYVATVKSRRSASIQPQVDGSLTRISVKSGDHVHAGQVLMTIDPLKQQATVDQQRSTEAQKKATFDYNQQEVERQRRLYEAGVTSKQNYDLAVQAFENSKADWESATAARVTAAAPACLLRSDRPIQWNCRRHPSPPWRLRFAADTVDHRGREC